MFDTLMEAAVRVLTALVLALISVGGTWLLQKLGQRVEARNVRNAVEEVIRIAELTVGELQQTLVEGMKAAHKDGKLTQGEIAELQGKLLDHVVMRISTPTCHVIESAGIDLESLIQGAAENWITFMKGAGAPIRTTDPTDADAAE